jgi:hypothetical protein
MPSAAGTLDAVTVAKNSALAVHENDVYVTPVGNHGPIICGVTGDVVVALATKFGGEITPAPKGIIWAVQISSNCVDCPATKGVLFAVPMVMGKIPLVALTPVL